ncbi:MAG: hypothetical protein J6C86_00260, partial [Bacteroidaceae bacterium]|nr:hypothetical protein [Bacteroidaceae bacterium]
KPQCGFEFSAHYFLFLYAQIFSFCRQVQNKKHYPINKQVIGQFIAVHTNIPLCKNVYIGHSLQENREYPTKIRMT